MTLLIGARDGSLSSEAPGARRLGVEDDIEQRRRSWLEAMQHACKQAWLQGRPQSNRSGAEGKEPHLPSPASRKADPASVGAHARADAGAARAGDAALGTSAERGPHQVPTACAAPRSAAFPLPWALARRVEAGAASGIPEAIDPEPTSPAPGAILRAYSASGPGLIGLTAGRAAIDGAHASAPASASACRAIGPGNTGDGPSFHVESSEAGIRVWLGAAGADGFDNPQLLAALLGELKSWAEGRGSRLLSFVYNGTSQYEEVPWTSAGDSSQHAGRIEERSVPFTHPEEFP